MARARPRAAPGLDGNVSAQATLKAFGQASSALKDAALDVEAKWLATCNAINADLGEDATQTSASKACGVLNARVKKAVDAGVKVTLDVKADCHADVSVQGDCQAKCKLPDCDIKAKCEPARWSWSAMVSAKARARFKRPAQPVPVLVPESAPRMLPWLAAVRARVTARI